VIGRSVSARTNLETAVAEGTGRTCWLWELRLKWAGSRLLPCHARRLESGGKPRGSNATVRLSGMGPVDRMATATGKVFSALYALFSGLVFVGVVGVVVARWIHRLLHWIHGEAP
jgi:hypothetical protein